MKKNIKHVSKRMLAIMLTTMIIMSTMIIGSISVGAAVSYWQVAGDFNSWNTSSSAYRINGNSGNVTLDLNDKIGSSISFKMVAHEGSSDTWCAASGLKMGTQLKLGWGSGDNMSLSITKRYVTFDIFCDGTDNYLTVTESNTKPGGEVKNATVYFKNTGSWGNVYIHYWGGTDATSWPGNKMTKVSGTTDIYSYSFPNDNNNCIFHNNSGGDSNQTDDLTVKDGYLYTWKTGGKSSNKDSNWSSEPYSPNSEITLTAATSSYGSLSFKVNGTSATTSKAGDTVTITVSPNSGYSCTGLTASYTNTSSTTTNKTLSVSGNTATFTVPDDVKVTNGKGSITFTASFAQNLTGVTLTASSTSITQGDSVTLTATPTPANITGCTYAFYRTTNNSVSSNDKVIVSSTSNKTTDTPDVGTYYYYVKATKGSNTVTSPLVKVEVSGSDGSHTIKVWFKSSSAFSYTPSVKLDNGSYQEMSRIKKGETGSTYIGSTYSGTLDFFWYYADIRVDSSTEHTFTFKTANTSVLATTESSEFSGSEYYFAVNNLMRDTVLVDLTGQPDYIKNYHRTATHMVDSGLIDGDSTLGYTFINGKEYAMGAIANEETAQVQSDLKTEVLTSRLTKAYAVSASSVGAGKVPFTIDSATLAQKCAADVENTSELQMALLDVNLDGKVDINDVTIMQKLLVQ
ncbi:MAG: starch-binding protein [Ruminococcus sp.]|nr:starch-binding protein [Ruminococcus sp.]